jgi:hypothetical protein
VFRAGQTISFRNFLSSVSMAILSAINGSFCREATGLDFQLVENKHLMFVA